MIDKKTLKGIQKHEKEKFGFFKSLTIFILRNGIPGANEITCSMPLINLRLWKVNGKTFPHKNGVMKSFPPFRPAYLKEFFRGYVPLVSSYFPIDVIIMGSFHFFKGEKFLKADYIDKDGNRVLNKMRSILAGSLAGFCGGTVVCPGERIQTFQNAAHNKELKLGEACKQIYKERGIFRGFWNGYTSLILRDALYCAFVFGLTPVVDATISKNKHISKFKKKNPKVGNFLSTLLSAEMTGIPVGFATCWLDSIRGIIQSAPLDQPLSIYGAVNSLLESGGLKDVLFKGLSWRVIRIGVIGAPVIVLTRDYMYNLVEKRTGGKDLYYEWMTG